jgi:hypothetical protein
VNISIYIYMHMLTIHIGLPSTISLPALRVLDLSFNQFSSTHALPRADALEALRHARMNRSLNIPISGSLLTRLRTSA